MNYTDFDVVVVGAGISGCVMAQQLAEVKKKVLIIDKRKQVGGNCFDFVSKQGILMSKYGPHIFRTNDKQVWNYVKSYSQWRKYEHRVVAKVGEKIVPMPVNRTTINMLFGEKLKDGKEMEKWLKQRREKFEVIDNAEKQVVSVMGREIYKLLFKGYTIKQWGVDPSSLDKSITERIPLRFNDDDRYYSDKYQYQPALGFTPIFKKMLESDLITTQLGVNFFEIMNNLPENQKIVFTGPIDGYYAHNFGKKIKLEYRSLKFINKILKQEYWQKNAVVNYPDINIPYTRITEHKYLTGQKHEQTVVTYEYPKNKGEPYYPVINKKNLENYKKIEKELLKNRNIVFLGRLGKFKYINMDVAIKEALETFEKLKKEKWFC